MSNLTPLPASPFDVSDEIRDRSYKMTAAALKELDGIRRALEMPADQLPIVVDIHRSAVLALLAEQQREEASKKVHLRHPWLIRSMEGNSSSFRIKNFPKDELGHPIISADDGTAKILPGRVVLVKSRMQWCAFRPEEFSIQGDRSRWKIHDIIIGNRSQRFDCAKPIAGQEFGAGGICERLVFETIQTAMDFDLVVEYVGPEKDGEVFEVLVVGTAADF